MNVDSVIWTSVEGIIIGMGIFCIVRTLICHFPRTSIKWAAYIWLFVYISNLLQIYLRRINILFVIYTTMLLFSILIFRVIILHNCMARIPGSYLVLRSSERYILVVFVSIYFVFIFLYLISLQCLFHQCHNDARVTTMRLFDIMANIFYTIVVLGLDIFFVVTLCSHLYRFRGGIKTLLYQKNQYHLVIQIAIFVSFAVNLYRIATSEYRRRFDQVVASLWLYPGTFLLISFLEFGTQQHELIRRSTPDTTLHELAFAHELNIKLILSKKNILKFLHHHLRNNVQKMTSIVDAMREDLTHRHVFYALHKVEYFSQIVNYVTTLIEDINIIDSTNKQFIITPRVFDVSNLLTHELRFAWDVNLGEGVMKTEVNVPSSLYVEGDPERFRQIIRILSEIFPLEGANANVKIHMTDDGQFKAYGSCDSSLILQWDDKELETGEDFIGLSMMIARRLIEAMGGRFYMSRDCKSFSIEIPFKVVTESAISRVPFRQRLISSPRRMLVVDDSTLNRKLLIKLIQNILDDTTLHIDEAADGEAALDMFTKSSDYDIVWMDVVMPVMDGVTAFRIIRQISEDVPIVLVTANEPHTLPADLMNAHYIQKPVKKSHIQDVLLKLFPSREG